MTITSLKNISAKKKKKVTVRRLKRNCILLSVKQHNEAANQTYVSKVKRMNLDFKSKTKKRKKGNHSMSKVVSLYVH